MKRLLLILALCSSPAWATWTHTQVKDTTGCFNNANTCAVTVTSTGAHHLLAVGAITGSSVTDAISSVTAGACNVAWVHCPNCSIAASGDGSVDISYCLDSVSGITSITITLASIPSANGIGIVWEASSSLGNIAKDSGATPSGTKNNSVNCLSCAGVPLTLSGNNNYVVAVTTCGSTCTGLTGTGWTNDLANPNGEGVGHGITTGSLTAPATWTQSPTGTMVSAAIAFQESSGGATKNCTLALMGAGPC